MFLKMLQYALYTRFIIGTMSRVGYASRRRDMSAVAHTHSYTGIHEKGLTHQMVHCGDQYRGSTNSQSLNNNSTCHRCESSIYLKMGLMN